MIAGRYPVKTLARVCVEDQHLASDWTGVARHPVDLSKAVHNLMGQEPPAVSETNEQQSSAQQALHQISMAASDQRMHQHLPAQWDQQAEAQRIQRDSNEMTTIILEKVIACHSLTLPQQLVAMSETVGPMALCLAESRSALRRTK